MEIEFEWKVIEGEFMRENKRNIGTLAELHARKWFERQHYQIIETNWYHQHREIDIIAENPICRVFVEVKFQSAQATVFPETKVNRQKQQFLQSCARSYQYKYPTKKSIRFDILAITQSNFSFQLFHMKDAFFGRISYKRSNRLSHFSDSSFHLTRF